MSGNAQYNPYETNVISVTADGGNVTASINGSTVAEYTDNSILSAGRVALYGSYSQNIFEYIEATPLVGKSYSVTRYDDTDEIFEYSGEWEHNLMCGFANYKRTLSTGKTGAKTEFSFIGTGFALFGNNDSEIEFSIELDGEAKTMKTGGTGCREIFCSESGLNSGRHNVKVTVISGELNIDGVQIEP